jgi:hypothetical protein
MERKKKKQVTFSQEAPLIKQYSNDFSADRKANSQTPEEYNSAKKSRKKEKKAENLKNIGDEYRFAGWWTFGGRKSKKRKSIRKTKKRRTRKIRK